MNKFSIFYLFTLFIILVFYTFCDSDYHKVLKVISPTEFYVDFNNNNVADIDELIVLDKFAYNSFPLTKVDFFRHKFFANIFTDKNLLNKYVRVVRSQDGITVTFLNGKNYSSMLVDNGIVFDGSNLEKIQDNIDSVKKLELVVYNTKTHKYHSLDCKYIDESPTFVVLIKKDLKKDASPCKLCVVQNATNTTYPRDVQEYSPPLYKDDFLEFYITDFISHYYPSSKCLTSACKSLLKEIDSAKFSIDFAIYGIDSQPEILNALVRANNRGVKIRWVYDTEPNGKTIYTDSVYLSKFIKSYRRDIDVVNEDNTKSTKDAIMHNKFFIFDNKSVWTGSANISKTDLSGFNANSVLLIKSPDVALAYSNEFEQMFSGKFHRLKLKQVQNFYKLGVSSVDVLFSPQDDIICNKIIPLINNANKYIYIPVFVVTHKKLNNALINAHNRGVDVRLIVDATSASRKYSAVRFLRENGIPVKVENRAGKMHMKSIIIDDEISVIGSMNFTLSGERYNDENVVIVNNYQLTKVFKERFLFFWTSIPDKWLKYYPVSESYESINSCHDGIDNDFDGKIDLKDEGCFRK